jgi:hypothetical protein
MAEIKKHEIVKMRLGDLIPNEKNPRIIRPKNFGALAHSLREFGNVGTIVFNTRTQRVVGGSQRLKVMKAVMGDDEETDVTIVDLDEPDEMALLMVLNSETAQGEWEVTATLTEIDKLKEEQTALFDKLNLGPLAARLRKIDAPTAKDADSAIPEMELLP